jgi:hypothetical protein
MGCLVTRFSEHSLAARLPQKQWDGYQQSQIDTAGKGRQRRIRGQADQGQGDRRLRRTHGVAQGPDGERKGQQQPAIERGTADVHLPEQRRRAVVAREIEQIGERQAFPQRRQRSGSQPKSHSQGQFAGHRRCGLVVLRCHQRNHQQRQKETPGNANTVHRSVVTLIPAENEASRIGKSTRHRQQQRYRHQAGQKQARPG